MVASARRVDTTTRPFTFRLSSANASRSGMSSTYDASVPAQGAKRGRATHQTKRVPARFLYHLSARLGVDRLPDQLADIDHELSVIVGEPTNLPAAHGQAVVQAAVAGIVGNVCYRNEDLSGSDGIGAAVPSHVKDDRRPVVRVDNPLQIGNEGPVRPPLRMIRRPEPAGDVAGAATLGNEEEDTSG